MVNTAKIGRFDGELKEVAFNDGDLISSLLPKVNITLGSGEGLNNESGETVNTSDGAVDGETYYIVGNYKQGAIAEDVKTFDKGLLSEAIGDVDKERAEIQKEKAKDVLREILSRKDVLEFNLSQIQEDLKKIDKELLVFKKK